MAINICLHTIPPMDFSRIAYSPLDYSFDHDLFVREYDQFIYPTSGSMLNGYVTWEMTRNLNRAWGMVDPQIYDKCDIRLPTGEVLHRGVSQWKMAQLMQLVTDDQDSEYVKSNAGTGGTYMRNVNLDRDWELKPEFKNLQLVQWIYNTLPFKKIVSMHCVSLDPGDFANIHRDSRWLHNQPNLALNNGVSKFGFAVITLNISDGGVPLYWALDGHAVTSPIKTNDPVYLISDYFLHGVPVCSSRRRQLRVTGIPTDELASHIDYSRKIELPNEYVFDDEAHQYPG